MKKSLFLTLFISMICCNACLKESGTEVSGIASPISKLVGNPVGEKQNGELLVCMSDSAVKDIVDGTFDYGCVFDGLEGFSISPVFSAGDNTVATKHGLHKWYKIGFDENISPETAATWLSGHPEIEFIEYNSILRASYDSKSIEYVETAVTKSRAGAMRPFNDMLLKDQWDLINDGSIKGSIAGADVGVKDAWRLTAGDPRVIVAVLDQGIATNHPDLEKALWTNTAELQGADKTDDDGNGYVDDKYGYNFADGTGKLSCGYRSDHGTHVAGTIGATNNNTIGISSIAGGSGNGDGVRLMSCQTFLKDGQTTSEWIAQAFRYAADNGAAIAQCSYGHNDMKGMSASEIADWMEESVEYKALQYFLDPANSNCPALETNIAVYSAGNYNDPASLYPGALKECISVTAFCPDFLPGGYSNYGAGCDISAPGGDIIEGNPTASCMILSTGINSSGSPSFTYKYGTSMACPHVSGVVALGMSYALKIGKRFSREDFISRLLTSANDIDHYNTGNSTKLWVRSYWDQTTEMWKEEYADTDVSVKKGKMGTGGVDAWNFLMALEGTPSFITTPDQPLEIDLSECLGQSYDKYSLIVPTETIESLGLSETPVINEGKLELTCTKLGAGKIRFKASVGKDDALVIPELDYYKEISIVSRSVVAKNGGWL